MTKERKRNQERARKLAEQGATTSQIAEILGVKYNTAYYYTHLGRERKKRRKKKESAAENLEEVPREMIGKPGWNTDRHACRSCRYRADGARKGCDYYMRTDLERGCDPAAFDKEKVIDELVELRQREYSDSDKDLESIDGEEIYDEGRSQGRFEAYHNAIKIVEKGGIE